MRTSGSASHRAAGVAAAALLLLGAFPVIAGPESKGAAPTPHGVMVDLKSGGKPMSGYLAKPAGKGPYPGIVVIQEWWGLNDQIKGVADRLAAEGYVALVPDLYHGNVTADPEKAHILMRALEDGEVLSDLGSAMSTLKSLPEVGSAKIGSIGFCMGGGYSLQLALNRSDLAGAVMFYGRPVTDPEALKKVSCPVLGLFGEEDEGIPSDKINAMAKGLNAGGKGAEVKIYPGAGHAFFNETRPSYNAEAAADAWKRTLAFFKAKLKG
jgi:carboxymethylenebutenolidase